MEHANSPATSIQYAPRLTPSRSLRHPRHRPTNSRANRVVRGLITSLILLFVLVSAACFIAWLALHPRAPVFRVDSLTVSGFNISSPQFAPRFNLELVISNPNRKIFFFIDHFGLLVSYRGIPLLKSAVDSSTSIKILGKRTSEVEFELDMKKLSDKKKRKVLRDIKGDWSRGVVSFQVKVNVRVKFRAGRWLSRQRFVDAFCKDLSVEFLPAKETGKLHDGGRICSVD